MESVASLLSTPKVVKNLLAILMVYICAGATFYHLVEKWNWLDSFYFSVISLATVGYGDIAPKTAAGKLFTMPFVFIGIGMFIAVANAFLKYRTELRLQKHQSRKSAKE